LESLSSFYSRFNNDPRVKICIDTCHVFQTGYDPLQYITLWNVLHPNSIKLIHLNDSVKPCGSCIDRHAPIGHGHIGKGKLLSVISWSQKYNIPMVIE
jgi:deoxyribonuclease-4